MSIKKVCVVITARPSYSRIKTALKAIDQHPALELQLVVAASALLDRYGSAVEYIESDGFKITEKVFTVLEGNSPTSMAKTTGIGIIELASTFDNLRPDMVVTIADRFETISTAIATSYMNIPLVHIQGGEVTGNIDEKVRHAISKLSDLHLVSTEDAKSRLIKMGEPVDMIKVTGCPSIDIAKGVIGAPDYDLYEVYGGVGPKIDPKSDYLVVMQHPVTTEFTDALQQIQKTLTAIKELNIPTFWFWPNVDAGSDSTSNGLRTFREENPSFPIHFFKNMEGEHFLKLLKDSRCLIGNSSVGIRECSYLGIPVVNIGSRQNNRLRGKNVVDVDYTVDSIVGAIKTQMIHGQYDKDELYGDGDSGKVIAQLLAEITPPIDKCITY